MARGYLGKISAIVSANTGDYVRKLEDSKRRTQAFATTIQNDLNRASKESSKAINAILTPLQRLERAIQNASSARLKFNGVDTAISNVKQLQAAVSRLEGTNIDVAVRTSGLQSLDELKRQVNSITQADLDLYVNLVGQKGTLADLRRIRETYQEIDGKTVSTDVRVKADVAQVDRLIELFGTLSKQRIDAVVRVVGERQVEQAARSMRQLASVANELATPLGRAAQQLGGMTNEIQVAFGPALQRAQRGVLNLQDDIERGANISEQRYAGVARAVDRVTAAVSRLNEAQSLANSGQTGQELAFRAPRVRDELSQSAALSQQASQLPAATLADDSIRQRVEDLARLRQEIARYQTSVEKRQVLGLDTTEASARLAAAIRQSAEVRGSLEQTIKVFVDTQEAERKAKELDRAVASLRENAAFVITGRVQNLDQVQSELNRVVGTLDRLTEEQRGGLDVRVQAVIEAIGRENLDDATEALDKLKADSGEAIKVFLDTEAAQQAADQLDKTVRSLRENAAFVITGRTQNIEQVESELRNVLASIGKLKDDARGDLQVQVDAVINAIDAKDFDAARTAVEQLRASAGNAITIDADTKAAEEKTKRLQASIDAVRQRVEFSITGNPQTFEQARQQFNAIFADFEKLSEASKRSIAIDITRVGELIEEGQESELANIVALLQRVKAGVDGLKGNAANLNFGLDLGDPQRQIEVLRGSVVSLKGQLDTLPAGIRAQFIPAIQQAEANLDALARSPAATAAELARARREIERLSQAASRAQQSLNIQSFRGFTETLATRGAIGELQALQGILARIQAQAGGPAAQAYDRYAAALRRAVREGTTQLPEVRRRLQELQVSAARAAAATGRISFSRALREIRRGGDIARGGFNNLSLAAQQAAFAIDDFFSVQGDFTQRLRAVQNNITQLAFIIGGTRGLFIGLGVVIAAQAAVALVNWINSGRTAEDQTKALNEALTRQKSLVEELAKAFESLGESIANRAFSRSSQEAKAFRKEIEGIERQQRELREARAFNANPDIGIERANQNRIQRELEQETNAGRRVALQRQLEESRQAEQRIRDSVTSRQAPAGAEVQRALEDILDQFAAASEGARRASRLPGGLLTNREAATAALTPNIQQLLRGTDFGGSIAAIESQLSSVRDAIGLLSPITDGGLFSGVGISAQASNAVTLLNQLAESLRLQRVDKELDAAAVRIFESGNRVASRIEQAQNSVAEAIEAGIPGARAVEQSLNRLGDQLRQAFTDLREAESIRDPTRRREAQDRIQERINTIQRRQRDEVAAADALRRETTLFPEQSIQNVISRIESGLSNLGGAGGNAQAELRRLQFERESIRQQRTAVGDNPFAARRLDIADAGLIDAIRSLEREVAELDETFNGFEARERDRFRGDAERGRELSLTPAQRAGEQLQQGLNDILARFGEVAENGNGLIDFQAAREAQLRFAKDQNRAAAPAIFNLADSVQNAILQGPSRAALNVSDISTQEGARELNRLLRGEDPARDNANLQELQRQSQILEENNRILREKLVAA